MAEGTDKFPWIVPLSKILTWKNMIQIGVKYLGFSVTNMLITLEEEPNIGLAKQSILNSFAGNTTFAKEVRYCQPI